MASPILWQKILALFTRADATDKAISNLESSLFDKIYPIGSVYISFSSVNPATLFGGTWEALPVGRVILQAGTGYDLESTGGEATVTLAVDQMPSHSHDNTLAEAGGHSHSRGSMEITGSVSGAKEVRLNSSSGAFTLSTSGESGMASVSGTNYHTFQFTASKSWAGATNTVANHNHTITNASAGSNHAHNNIQPYIAANMWRRIA